MQCGRPLLAIRTLRSGGTLRTLSSRSRTELLKNRSHEQALPAAQHGEAATRERLDSAPRLEGALPAASGARRNRARFVGVAAPGACAAEGWSATRKPALTRSFMSLVMAPDASAISPGARLRILAAGQKAALRGPMSHITESAPSSFAGLAACAVPARRGGLGGTVDTIQSDVQTMHATRRVAAHPGYDVHELTLASGTVVREFVGPGRHRLRRRLARADQARPSATARHRAFSASSRRRASRTATTARWRFAIPTWSSSPVGRMRNFAGRAYLPGAGAGVGLGGRHSMIRHAVSRRGALLVLLVAAVVGGCGGGGG